MKLARRSCGTGSVFSSFRKLSAQMSSSWNLSLEWFLNSDWPRNNFQTWSLSKYYFPRKWSVSFFLRDVLLSCNTLESGLSCFRNVFRSPILVKKSLTFPNLSARVPYLVTLWSHRIWWTADELNKAKTNSLSGPRFTQLPEKLLKFMKCHWKAILENSAYRDSHWQAISCRAYH